MRLLLELSYDGTEYYGWQIQPHQITIQEVLQKALLQLTGRPCEITGCGRTDTGVHASQYFAHFDLMEEDISKINVYKLNSVLPQSIAIKNIFNVQEDFHARYDAYFRKYIYRIHTVKNPFIRNYSFLFTTLEPNHLHKLNEVAQLIFQTKDFTSFAKSKSGLKNFNCEISESYWKSIDDYRFEYHISSNRFVRGMVRLCVGACLSYVLDKLSLSDLKFSIENKSLLPYNWSVPAHGLSLEEIRYSKPMS